MAENLENFLRNIFGGFYFNKEYVYYLGTHILREWCQCLLMSDAILVTG